MQVDLRSDTVTKPTPAMREAMAAAVVGDDVLGEDPTVNALEARCAQLGGKEAALFVPSGTMANLIACRAHTQPADEVILERTSHLYRYEVGGYAAVAGVSVALLDGVQGQLRAAQLAAALRPDDIHSPRSRLLWLENTHNYGNGSCYPMDALVALQAAAKAQGLSMHIDGARVWNAMVAKGYSLAEVARCTDSLSFCFSKGLGCPVGSMLIGDGPWIRRARRLRKLFGGGMRQAGILAAAALYALDNHVVRLADDHERARQLGQVLAERPGIEVEPIQTNIIFANLKGNVDAANAAQQLALQGIHTLPLGKSRLRFVTHLDIDDSALEWTCERLRQQRFA